jgi:hypothetical protein
MAATVKAAFPIRAFGGKHRSKIWTPGKGAIRYGNCKEDDRYLLQDASESHEGNRAAVNKDEGRAEDCCEALAQEERGGLVCRGEAGCEEVACEEEVGFVDQPAAWELQH